MTKKKLNYRDVVVITSIIILYLITIILFYRNKGEDTAKVNYCIPPYYIPQSPQEETILNELELFNREEYKKIEKYLKKKCDRKYEFKFPTIIPSILLASKIFELNPMLISAIIVYESNCNPYAVNPESKAFGLMQIHPVHKPQLFIGDMEHILKGASILKYCKDKYKDIKVVLECYGAGEEGLSEKISSQSFNYPLIDSILNDLY